MKQRRPDEEEERQENDVNDVTPGGSARRPGPHGAEASSNDEANKAYRRTRGHGQPFQEISPKPVTAAEAVTSLTEETEEAARTRGGLLKSRACFIATAAYGNADAPEVERLRRFRDQRLLTNPVGTAFVRLYYRMSPPVARLIARNPRLRMAVRRCLDVFKSKAAL